MAERLQDWVAATVEDSQAQWAYIQEQELDDTFGWGAMTGVLLSRMGSRGVSQKEQSRNSCGLLITGPEGCGKHNTAAHMMVRLQEEYEMVFLNGMTLSALGAVKSRQFLEALLESFIRKDRALCIQLEDMEDCPCRRELLTYFGQQLRNYRIADFPPLFLILIDSREQDIPSCLRSQLLLCRMSVPTQAQRMEFLKVHAKDLRNTLSLTLFARATEGANYAQLLDMIAALNWLVDSQDLMSLPDADLLEFLDTQMPVPSKEDSLQKLTVTAQHLMEQLPQLLKDSAKAIPAAAVNPQPVPVPAVSVDTNNTGGFVDRERNRIENLSFRQLADELFGQDGSDEISRVAEAQLA